MSRHQPVAHGARDRFPTNVPDLLKHLDTLCPEPSVRPDQPIEKIMFEAGRRDLVHQLRREFERSVQRPDSI
ncbi:hypothetical protein [Brevundimonas diminuta]|uniref:hypothetical protein n=1 Tax=Brevundimonas diminuta TaxID=293 RepID=UPI001F566E42|nr:hypothetical protein [Brevundimonas diminuta]